MPQFHYRAKKNASETVVGKIEAQNQEEAVELINRLGLLPVVVQEGNLSTVVKAKTIATRHVKAKEIIIFSGQLAYLIKAGIPILRALDVLNGQIRDAYFKSVIQAIYIGIKEGRSFSDCLSDYPKVFSPLFVAMVRAGEEGGHLKEALLKITEYQKRQEGVYGKIRLALIYPAFMGIVGFLTVVFILSFVMPKLTGMFSSFQEQLPLPTKILLGISDFLKIAWPLILLAFLALAFFLQKWADSKAGQLAISLLKLRLPLFGNIVLRAEMARFCRTLELLMRGGTPLIQSLDVAIPTLTNEMIKMDLKGCHEKLRGGAAFSQSLQNSRWIPAMTLDLISVGEESGLLEDTFRDIAENFEEEVDEALKAFTSLLEPVMILTVGLVVGFMVIAMLLPIFQMDIMAR